MIGKKEREQDKRERAREERERESSIEPIFPSDQVCTERERERERERILH